MKQNTIALVYDFDGTLTPKTMQEYTVIPRFKLNSKKFWKSIMKSELLKRSISSLFLNLDIYDNPNNRNY